MQWIPILWLALLGQTPRLSPAPPENEGKVLEKSTYFAFVDRDYIFTVEFIAAGVPLLNFVSMTDDEVLLPAKQVRLTLENRKVPVTSFVVDTGDPRQPMIIPSLKIRPRSSFGVQLRGDFGDVKEALGVTIGVGAEDFKLAPLTGFDFENLVLKVDRINLGSPDFRDDWRVLKLDFIGTRGPAARR